VSTIVFIDIRSDYIERIKPMLAAKALGLEVILLVDKKPAIDENLAQVIVLNTFDKAEVLATLEKISFDAVLTWGDKDVELVAEIGRKYKLPALAPEAARCARNKFLMRQAVSRQFPQYCPSFFAVETLSDLESALAQIRGKAILKPVGASGSKAIYSCDGSREISALWKEVANVCFPEEGSIFTYYPNQFICEERMAGDEFSVEGLVADGEIHVLGITDKRIETRHFTEIGHIFPSRFTGTNVGDIINDGVRNIVRAIGLNNCAFHFEGVYTSQGLRMFEIAARAGGGYIASWLVEEVTGVPYTQKIIEMALGRRVWMEAKADGFAGVRFVITPKPGIFKEVRGVSGALETPYVRNVIVKPEFGDKIGMPPTGYNHRICAILAHAPEYSVLQDALDQAAAKLDVIVE
jgi:biotin carboxylase